MVFNLLLKLKNKLSNISLLYSFNALIKSRELKKNFSRLAKFYLDINTKRRIFYDEENSLALFKARFRLLRSNYVTKNVGRLNIFWVGANRAQDETGLLQSLYKLGSLSIFNNNPEYNYGPLFSSEIHNWLWVRQQNDEALVQQVTAANEKHGIDVLIGQMWAHLYSASALKRIRELGIPVINIAMDDRLPVHWSMRNGHRLGSVGLGEGLDMVLTTSAETCQWYNVEGIPSLFWPLASDAKLFSPTGDSPRDIDVLFIGNRYGIRLKIIEYLSRRGINVTCFGNGWPNGEVGSDQNVSLSKRAKIILGVGTIGHTSDFYTLKLRDFDALMTGALYVTHRNPDLLKIFTEGIHLVCYETLDELYQKLIYYLRNSNERELIGRQGQRLAQKKHTWDYRFNDTFNRLGLIKEV